LQAAPGNQGQNEDQIWQQADSKAQRGSKAVKEAEQNELADQRQASE
jgi:hypothetical protein